MTLARLLCYSAQDLYILQPIGLYIDPSSGTATLSLYIYASSNGYVQFTIRWCHPYVCR